MSIGRLQASLAAATNEVTVAAANINFDFALVKYEAPREYQPVGTLLSVQRKHNAEYGSSHITARSLGALFEGICELTPNLVRAYGTRVSEIAKSAAETPSNNVKSLFDSFSGVDGTTIWAAATSSTSSIHVHMLSCMLARVFEAPEAISIWVELVNKRRSKIANDLENGTAIPFSLATAAAQRDIMRTQLAEWDASARAWLCTADKVKARQQTQLLLILENIHLEVSAKTAVFSSVTEAWQSALKTMEKLISGQPQAVSDGAALVGLSAWHLYPDMTVFGTRTVEVHMKDALFASGGILSLGLSKSQQHASGVYWSLSLAHMRFYGQPVQSRQQMNADPRKISFSQLQIVIIGMILEQWQVTLDQSMSVVEIIHLLGTVMQQYSSPTGDDRWVDMLVHGASAYLHAAPEARDMVQRLIRLGRKRAFDFIQPQTHDREFAGFLDVQSLLRVTRGAEEQISILRRLVAEMPELKNESILIRCFYQQPARPIIVNPEALYNPLNYLPGEHSAWVHNNALFTTATPGMPQFLRTPGDDSSDPHHQLHHCWTEGDALPAELHSIAHVHHSSGDLGYWQYESHSRPQFYLHVSKHLDVLFGDMATTAVLLVRPQDPILDGPSRKRARIAPMDTTAQVSRSGSLDHKTLLWCLQREILDPKWLIDDFQSFAPSIYKTLLLCAYAENVYKGLPEAGINIKVLSRSFLGSNFARYVLGAHNIASVVTVSASSQVIQPAFTSEALNPLDLPGALGLLTLFEGCHDIDLMQLQDAMAISIGDSIYMSKQLVSDPFAKSPNDAICHILGNVGKSGVVILVPPPGNLMIQEPDEGQWMVCNSSVFDGIPEDSFRNTSLHLSFSDYHVPMIETGTRGQQDSSLSMLESIISVRDSGSWIADTDILAALNSDFVFRMDPQKPCHHPKQSGPPCQMLCAESWNDLLDLSKGRIIAKAHDNWVARLAIVAVLAKSVKRKPDRIIICPRDVCWQCVEQSSGRTNSVYIY